MNSSSLKLFILKSSHNYYIENKIKKVNIINKLGEGSYGIVYQLDNEHVIKIFKNSTVDNIKTNENSYLLPIKNENRELLFF